MVSGRVYQPPVPRPVALEELRRCAGRQFDPTVVEAFLAMRSEIARRIDDRAA
jgi:response regulator RpfG family c-di-GMP phosphodiesterase